MSKISLFILPFILVFAVNPSFLLAGEGPNVERVIETFIPIEASKETIQSQVWQDYLHLLRSVVSPLVRDLRAKGAIDWYCFLVHAREDGVPTSADDKKLYVHLRMSLTKNSNEAEFIERLPSFCRFSRKMSFPNPPSLDWVDLSTLAEGQFEQGWKVLGESSEWVLRMLDAHDPSKPIPRRNVAQFLHYIGNQLFVESVGIPMP